MLTSNHRAFPLQPEISVASGGVLGTSVPGRVTAVTRGVVRQTARRPGHGVELAFQIVLELTRPRDVTRLSALSALLLEVQERLLKLSLRMLEILLLLLFLLAMRMLKGGLLLLQVVLLW